MNVPDTASRVEIVRGGRVEDQDSLSARAGRRQSLQCGEPAGGVPPGKLVLGAAVPVLDPQLDRREQQILDGPLDRAESQAFLEQAVCALLVEGRERARQPRRRRGSIATLAGERDRRGDIAGLVKRRPQRLDLGQLVLPMAPG
jgi:hypothetical protein